MSPQVSPRWVAAKEAWVNAGVEWIGGESRVDWRVSRAKCNCVYNLLRRYTLLLCMGRAIHREVALHHIVVVLGHCGGLLVAVAGFYKT